MSGDRDDLSAAPQSSAATLEPAVAADDDVLRRIHAATSYVETLVASWNGPTTFVERRRWHRIPYDRPILITPLDDETHEPTGPPQMVPGRDISLGGVSFIHRDPLASRKVACRFEPNSGTGESVIVRLTWCRFTKEGWYQSGGQFVQSISRNVDAAASNSPSGEVNS